MGAISKILNKINKAKSAINSLKGIGAKLESLNYTSQVDKLGEQAEHAQQVLKDRRSSLQASIDSATKAKAAGKSTPDAPETELRYPLNDWLPNYIVFTTRKRVKRFNRSHKTTTTNVDGKITTTTEDTTKGDGVANGNIFSGSSVEIMLYVPDGITSEVSVGYESQGIGVGARALNELIDTGKDLIDGASTTAQAWEKGGEVGKAVVKTQLTSMANSMTGGIRNIKQGRAVNPMKEQMLKGSDFRSFTFNYEFWPKNAAEANMVNKIIYTFRTAMLPDTYGHSTAEIENYLNYPNIFDVDFDGPLAGKVDGFLPMVCTECSVDHFNGNKVTTLANGQPVSTSMKLTFQEIKILSQSSYHNKVAAIGPQEGKVGLDSLVADGEEYGQQKESTYKKGLQAGTSTTKFQEIMKKKKGETLTQSEINTAAGGGGG